VGAAYSGGAADRGHRVGGGATIRCRGVCEIRSGAVLVFEILGAICGQPALWTTGYGVVRWRTHSKHTTAAALATLSDSTPPAIGMPTQPVSCAATAGEIPEVSLPST
jgi:hypothetical protein